MAHFLPPASLHLAPFPGRYPSSISAFILIIFLIRMAHLFARPLPLTTHSTSMPKFQPPRAKTVAVRVWLKFLWSDRATYRAAARSKKDAHSAVNPATFVVLVGVLPTVCLMFSCSAFSQGNMEPTSVLSSSSTCCTSYCLCGPVSVSSASRRQGTFSWQ